MSGATRTPAVQVFLCPPCGGYEPLAGEGYSGQLSGQCDGCGQPVREVHRFSVVPGTASGCTCSAGHDRRTGTATAPGSRRPSAEEMLREFHSAKDIHGGLMPAKPTANVPVWVRELRIKFLEEEVKELVDAMRAGDLTGILDGACDVVTVVVGTTVPYGLPFDEGLAEVHRSNMTKDNDPAKGKLIKGSRYEPPRLAEIIARRVAGDVMTHATPRGCAR